MRGGIPRATLLLALGAFLTACEAEREEAPTAEPVELARFPIDSGAVRPGSAGSFDPAVSQDGRGSLRVYTEDGGLLRLYELDEIGEVSGQVTLTGFLRSQGLRGQAMLELRCRPAQGNEAFIRGIQHAVSGDSDWRPQEVRFADPALCRDPAAVRINLLVRGGPGTVWVDDLRLWSVPAD